MTAENGNTHQANKVTSEPYSFKKRHGSTNFHVVVYSNPDATETVQDKITRLIRNEAEFHTYNDPPKEGASP